VAKAESKCSCGRVTVSLSLGEGEEVEPLRVQTIHWVKDTGDDVSWTQHPWPEGEDRGILVVHSESECKVDFSYDWDVEPGPGWGYLRRSWREDGRYVSYASEESGG
jgi:hypothetical protein